MYLEENLNFLIDLATVVMMTENEVAEKSNLKCPKKVGSWNCQMKNHLENGTRNNMQMFWWHDIISSREMVLIKHNILSPCISMSMNMLSMVWSRSCLSSKQIITLMFWQTSWTVNIKSSTQARWLVKSLLNFKIGEYSMIIECASRITLYHPIYLV